MYFLAVEHMTNEECAEFDALLAPPVRTADARAELVRKMGGDVR